MAPQSHVVVTLRLPKEQLEPFDFSSCKPLVPKKPRKRPSKPRTGRAAGSKRSSEAADDDGDELGTPPASKRLASVEPRGPVPGSGIISGGGADPILGNLPRSVKSAPVANTSGLDLDKTPCRRWTRRPVIWKSFTGVSYTVMAWCSDYSAKELEEKVKREAELEQQASEKEKSGRGAKRSAAQKPGKAKPRKPKGEPGPDALPTREGSEQQDENIDDQEAPSELASDLPSEPPSEAPSQPPAPTSELDTSWLA